MMMHALQPTGCAASTIRRVDLVPTHSLNAAPPVKIISSLILLVFGILWCGFLVFIDKGTVRSLRLHFHAKTFPATGGTITKSEVKVSSRSNGQQSYRAEIAYGYTADGRKWAVPRRAFGDFYRLNGRKQAEQLTAAMPEGKTVTVYFDPASPGESVLGTGLQSQHLLFALFVAPFHLVSLGALVSGVSRLVRRIRGVRPVRLRKVNDYTAAVRVPWVSPFWVGLITLGVGAFVMLLVVGLAFPLPITMQAIILAWILILIPTAYMAARRVKELRAGVADLIIDMANRQITLPPNGKRQERTTISWDSVQAVTVRLRPVESIGKNGQKTSTYRGASSYLAFIDRNNSLIDVVDSPDDIALQSIAQTLSSTYGWPLKSAT
jgi:hypothetical protein